jgi:hypothetical protein
LYSAVDPDLRDEDECAPSFRIVKESVRLVLDATKLLDAIPPAQVSTFFGEINITWRFGERIVRLALFENRPAIVQTGSLSEPMGRYESQENPSAATLAEKLKEFTW